MTGVGFELLAQCGDALGTQIRRAALEAVRGFFDFVFVPVLISSPDGVETRGAAANEQLDHLVNKADAIEVAEVAERVEAMLVEDGQVDRF